MSDKKRCPQEVVDDFLRAVYDTKHVELIKLSNNEESVLRDAIEVIRELRCGGTP